MCLGGAPDGTQFMWVIRVGEWVSQVITRVVWLVWYRLSDISWGVLGIKYSAVAINFIK